MNPINASLQKIPTEIILKTIWESPDDGIIAKDINGTIIAWSQGAQNIYGYTDKEAMGKSIEILLPKERFGELTEIFKRLKRGERIYHYETIRVRKDGTLVDISSSIAPIFDPNNSVIGAISIARDISKQQSQKKFVAAVDAAPNGMLMINRAGLIELVNTQICKMFGYTKEELLGQKIEVLVPERFRSKHPSYRMDFFAKPQTRLMGAGRDLYGLKKNGSEFPVEIGLNPLITDEGTFVLASVVDITERKREAQKFEIAVEAAPTGMIMINKMGEIELVNGQILSMFGYKKEDVVGQKIECLVPKRFRDKHPQYRSIFFAEPQPRAMGAGRELFGLRMDGTEFPVEIGLNPLKTDAGVFVLASVVDISERKKQEDTRRSNVELEQFAYVVSHDLKAPLRGIASIAEWVIQDYKDKLDPKGQENLVLLGKRVDRMQNLINGVLEYSRIGRIHEESEKVDLNKLLPQVIELLNPPKHIKVNIHKNLPVIHIEKIRIHQVFQNLIGNAINYIDKKEGLIEVGCEENGNVWKFSVKDNGPGIEKRHFEKIFQIFQTLAPKDTHESTGIGLTLVKKIVETYGGKVWVESEIKKGSTFYFTLPKPPKPKQGAA